MRFGSLFAGIGGMDLGLERAGMECAWQVEINPFCQKVLAKHWPSVRRWDDVRTFPPDDGHDYSVDLIAGGFPCQDLSVANSKGKGLDGERSGLWFEFHRIVRALLPRFVLVENVSGLLIRGLGRVLGDMATLGYDAEWDMLAASDFGAPHIRERLFLLAYDRKQRWMEDEVKNIFVGQIVQSQTNRPKAQKAWGQDFGRRVGRSGRPMPDSRFCGVDDGVPSRMDRVGACGNAVVPQVAEWIGRRIMELAEKGAKELGIL